MRQVPVEQTGDMAPYFERGETVEITSRSRVIGRIVPVGELDDLIAAGRVVPATIKG